MCFMQLSSGTQPLFKATQTYGKSQMFVILQPIFLECEVKTKKKILTRESINFRGFC